MNFGFGNPTIREPYRCEALQLPPVPAAEVFLKHGKITDPRPVEMVSMP